MSLPLEVPSDKRHHCYEIFSYEPGTIQIVMYHPENPTICVRVNFVDNLEGDFLRASYNHLRRGWVIEEGYMLKSDPFPLNYDKNKLKDFREYKRYLGEKNEWKEILFVGLEEAEEKIIWVDLKKKTKKGLSSSQCSTRKREKL